MKRCLLVGAALASAVAFANVTVVQDRPDALYRVGEEASFTVTVTDDATGAPKTSGRVRWQLDAFGPKVIAKWTNQDLSKGNPFTVKGALDTPGFLRLSAFECGTTNRVVWGVGYEVEKIRQAEPRPADFDAYWAAEKARLEKEVSLDAQVTRDAKLSDRHYDVFRVSFATFRGNRVYGFMSVPTDKSKAPFRVHVTVPGAGPGMITCPKSTDEVFLVMNVHPFDAKPTAAEQRDALAASNAALAKKYDLPPAEQTAYACAVSGIGVSREEYFFHDVMLGINRAVNWAATQPYANPKDVIYHGSSQGGLFCLYLTYLNDFIRRSVAYVPAGSGHYAYREGCQNGWPNLIQRQKASDRTAAEKNAAYFDGINFAAGITKPIRFVVGFADTCCPPHVVYAAYNVLKSKDKEIANAIGSGHSWSKNPMGRAADAKYKVWLREK